MNDGNRYPVHCTDHDNFPDIGAVYVTKAEFDAMKSERDALQTLVEEKQKLLDEASEKILELDRKMKITQDAATRKGAVNVHDGSDAAYVELGTSCTTLELPPGFPTVKIGGQTWTAKNLDIDDGGEGIYHHGGETFYTWDAAVRVCGKLKGWHLPSKAEWETLFNAVGGQSVAGTKLKSTSGWDSNGNGTDDFSFSALPAGDRYKDGNYGNEGNGAYFWSSTENDRYFAYYMFLLYDFVSAYLGDILKYYGFSVRCLKD